MSPLAEHPFEQQQAKCRKHKDLEPFMIHLDLAARKLGIYRARFYPGEIEQIKVKIPAHRLYILPAGCLCNPSQSFLIEP